MSYDMRSICYRSTAAENATEVKNNFIVAPRQRLERFMGGEKYYNIRFLISCTIVRNLEHIVRGDIRLYNHDIGIITTLHHLTYNLFSRRFAKVVDIWLKCQTHHGNDWFAVVF